MSEISHQQAFIAQMTISVLYTVGFFGIIIIVALGYSRVPTESRDAFIGLLNLMGAGQGLIVGYWFSRQRQSGAGTTS
jgi:hypothetical protein